jgi:trimeric autotransporter adhesin
VIATVAGNGKEGFSGDGGKAISAQLGFTTDIAVDSAGNLYIASLSHHRIRKVTPAGIITTIAGNGVPGCSGDGGKAMSAQLHSPDGVAVDLKGNIYIADLSNYRIRKVTPDGAIATVAGNGADDSGKATSARLRLPHGVTVDSAGNLYIADTGYNRIRKVTPAGVITIIAGDGLGGFYGDGGKAASAKLDCPDNVAVDSAGNLYIADTDNHRIRKITPSGAIATVAGNGTIGFSGDGGQAASAQLNFPSGVAVDSAGSLYIADSWNHRIRKITPAGVITTIAGKGAFGYSGDGGQATSAQLNVPRGVAVDSIGNLYIADSWNHRIRKVTPAGAIVTVAGNGKEGFGGDGGQAASAQLNLPFGVALDVAGNLYIADYGNNRVRKVTPAGVISSFAGDGTGNYGGDGGKAASAHLSGPYGIAVDSAGNLYIADANNHRIRKVLLPAR